jgi:hypothetical protein
MPRGPTEGKPAGTECENNRNERRPATPLRSCSRTGRRAMPIVSSRYRNGAQDVKRTLNPPSHSVVRPNLVLGRRVRRTQRKLSHQAQNAKTTVTNVAQPLSFDPAAEPVIQRRTMKRTLNPPSHSVVRPNLVLGRRVRMTRALTALNSGSLIAIFACAINLGHECNDNEKRPSSCLPRLLAIAGIRQCSL